jgi:hypothetical protein
MDADGVTSRSAEAPPQLVFACATVAEQRAGRRAGVPTALVGLGAVNGVPGGRVVSFGLAGALDSLPVGTVIDATRVVAEDGGLLWEGGPLGIAGAQRGTILAAARLIDDAAERGRLHAATGAVAADLESGPLAGSGRLGGVLRVVSDTPERPLGGLAGGVTAAGRYDWPGLAKAFVRSPRACVRAAAAAGRALRELTEAARRVPA